jgi:hypothetical protein
VPIPLLIWAGAAAVAAAGAAVAGWLALDAMSKAVQDKVVLVVGPRLAGKTLLHARLTTGRRSAEQLAYAEETFDFKAGEVDISSLGWKVKAIDAPTTKGADREMAEQVARADLVVFIADGSLLSDPAYRTHAESMATTLRNFPGTDSTEWALMLSHSDVREAMPSEWSHLAKLLDEADPLSCDLTEEESSGLAVARVLHRLVGGAG